MRLTTLNLEGFNHWQDRQEAIEAYLKRIDADIIFFQEVVFLPRVSPYNGVQLLNETLGYPYEHTSISRLQVGIEDPVFREGLGVLSKYPINKTDVIILKKAEEDEHNRIIQLIDVTIDDTVIKMANIHYSITDFTDLATAHLQETLEILHARNEKRIIAGDFNMDYLEERAFLWEDEYEASTVFPYVSYPSMNKRNDYVLVPKSMKIESVSVSDDELSDHTALTAEISL